MFGIGTTELMIIMAVVLLIFGGKKLPELARSMGQGIREFKNEVKQIDEPISNN